MSKINLFEENVSQGKICEDKIKMKFKEIFAPILNHIIYGNSIYETNIQKSGVDFIINKKSISFDVKCRDFYSYKFKDILLETISIIEFNKLGWLHTSDSNAIVYLWKNPSGTKFIDGYILFLEEIRKWIKDRKYPEREACSYNSYGNSWHTRNICVPIKDFPSNCIMQINKMRLNPTENQTLQKWFQ